MWAEPFGGHEPDALQPFAEQLRRRHREAESALIEVDVQLGVEDVGAIERAVDRDPLDERLWGFLMIALYRRGRQTDALRAYGRARTLLADEVGVEPGPFLRAIEQEVLLQHGPHLEPFTDPPQVNRSVAESAPPAAVNDVVFREAECAALHALLARSRFVSLVGPPGVGKTTVAAEVARSWTATPVAWLGLGDVASWDACVIDVAVRLGVMTEADAHEDAHATALESLIGDSPLLIVLDNVEHLVGAIAPFVTRLLQRCRNVTVLTTSRRELGEPTERVLPLRPFDTVAAGTAHTDDVTLSNGAAYLAIQAGSDTPVGDEAATLNRIASDLGGIALGARPRCRGRCAGWVPPSSARTSTSCPSRAGRNSMKRSRGAWGRCRRPAVSWSSHWCTSTRPGPSSARWRSVRCSVSTRRRCSWRARRWSSTRCCCHLPITAARHCGASSSRSASTCRRGRRHLRGRRRAPSSPPPSSTRWRRSGTSSRDVTSRAGSPSCER